MRLCKSTFVTCEDFFPVFMLFFEWITSSTLFGFDCFIFLFYSNFFSFSILTIRRSELVFTIQIIQQRVQIPHTTWIMLSIASTIDDTVFKTIFFTDYKSIALFKCRVIQ
jgi:hypothetical protein